MDRIRLALRMLGRRPGLTAGRLLTVTIVVTAVSAVFTVASATYLRPLPFPHADRLVRLYMQPPGRPEFRNANPLSPLEFERYRASATSFEGVEGIWVSDRALSGDGEPEAIAAGRVSAGFFTMFGGAPALGRTFTEDEVASDAKLAVLGHGVWMRRYGGDPAVIGRTLLVDGEPHVVIGVMRAGFQPAFARSEFWTPLSTRNAMAQTTLTSVLTFARLKPGHTIAQSVPEVDRILADLARETPVLLKGWTAGMKDLREAQFGQQGPAVLMLLAAAVALGLIAVANLANLTLADVMFRRSDFAVRAALGASRGALASGELVQALVLAVSGAAAGLAAASWVVPAMLRLDTTRAITPDQAPLDWRVALFALAAALLVMMAAVVLPVVRLTGPALASDVAAGNRRAIGGRAAQRTRIILVTAQTALALVLLSAGAQIVWALQRSARADPGFDPSNVVTAQLRLSARSFPGIADRATFIARVLERLEATPGILAAGTTLNTFSPIGAFVTLVQVEDRPSASGEAYTVSYRRVSPGYFEAMRIPIARGRGFERRDWTDAPPVAIVSRGFARRFWGSADPIGRRVKRGPTGAPWSTIVGVVEDARDVGLNQDAPETIYTPYYQGSNPAAPVALVVRTSGDPRGMIGSIKAAVWAVDASQPLANVVTMEQFLADSLGPQRFRALLITACAVVGLLLATIGTYGVTARSVVERTREAGIRLALGGPLASVWWTIAWGSLRAVVAGAAVGLVVSVAAAAALSAVLPEVRGAPWLFGAAAGGALTAIGSAAAMLAARAVTAIDPLRALRAD